MVARMTSRPFSGVPDDETLETLRHWARSGTLPHRLVQRSRIVCLAIAGYSLTRTARELRVSTHTVALWRKRFLDGGLDGLTHDAPGRGRKPKVTHELVAGLRSPGAAAAPSVRHLARTLGVSKSSVHRALRRPD
jgi:transposase-like protein